MSTQTTLNGESLGHPTKEHLTKDRPPGKSLPVNKDREWYCLECRRRITESPDGKEFGHEYKTAGPSRTRCPIRDEQGLHQ